MYVCKDVKMTIKMITKKKSAWFHTSLHQNKFKLVQHIHACVFSLVIIFFVYFFCVIFYVITFLDSVDEFLIMIK